MSFGEYAKIIGEKQIRFFPCDAIVFTDRK